MTDEHRSPTDEELARWSRTGDNCHRRLIAEVRRLRGPVCVGDVFKERQCGGIVKAVVSGISREGLRPTIHLRALNKFDPGLPDGYSMFEDDLWVEWVRAKSVVGGFPDRTLTLPNGTVVRAGDVLVMCTDGAPDVAVRVSAVGSSSFLTDNAMLFFDGHWHDYPIGEIHRQVDDTRWRPWSEVYPDRPAPGGE